MQELEITPEEIPPARSGEKLFIARDDKVSFTWNFSDDGASVTGMICIPGTKFGLSYELHTMPPYEDAQTYTLATMKIKVWLEKRLDADAKKMSVYLYCELPLTRDEGFKGAIGHWHTCKPQPGPSPTPTPTPTPIPCTVDECRDADLFNIEAPAQAADLFPFVWIHAPEPCAPGRIGLRYTFCDNYKSLDLYQKLLALTGPDAAKGKRLAAITFRAGSEFVNLTMLLTQLPLTVDFPALRCALECMSEDQRPEEVVLEQLGMSATDFLQQPTWPGEYAMVWQSLFALALIGTPADASLTRQLTDIARMAQFLSILSIAPERLATADARWSALRARLVLPDAIAAYGPSPTLSGPILENGGDNNVAKSAGIWEVLGIGSLKMARQRLHGYLPGELAEIVNVMPRERQEVQERVLTQNSEHSQFADEQLDLSSEQHHSAASSDLSDAMHALMTADGLVRNLNDIRPTYEDLDLTLSGTAYGGDARSAWSMQNAAQLAQRMTEQAASQLSKRIGSQRSKIWQQLQERRQSNLIDNGGNDRLVGVYCWVDRVLRIHLESMGQRLVLSFQIDYPAQDWLAQLKADQGIAPQPPTAPLTFGAADGKGYLQVTADTYLSYGAFYGLHDLPPPPPPTLRLNTSFDRVNAGTGATVVVPNGYVAVSGKLSIALADNRYNVVCAVAGEVIAGTSTPVPPLGGQTELKVDVPQSSGNPFGPAVTEAVPAQSVLIAADLDSQVKNLTGAIPVTVMSAAPAFLVNIELQCQLGTGSVSTPAMVNWQVEIYQRLWQADRETQRHYATAVSAGIAAACAGRSGAIQRAALRETCLFLLANQTPQDQRTLAPLMDWQAMTWQYEPWPVGKPDRWPQLAPSATTETGSDRLMQQFLRARAARVLLPVNAGCEAWLLYWLQFQQPWAGGSLDAPVTENCLPLLEQVARPQPLIGQRAPWMVRLPTSMLYLLQDGSLPNFSPI